MLALVCVPIASLYHSPDSHFPKSDELFYGSFVNIKQVLSGSWCKVRTFYRYEGYVSKKQLLPLPLWQDIRQKSDRKHCGTLKIVTKNFCDLLAEPSVKSPLLDTFPCGSFFYELGKEQGYSKILLFQGVIGYCNSSFLSPCPDYSGQNRPDENDFRHIITKTALSYLGTPYRWGGKSHLGIDCSGLTFMSYMENGVLIYRDAEIVPGYPIHPVSREELKKGDLIFFPGHVAMYLGNDRYIHSTAYAKTPYVTINSLNPGDEDYREDLDKKVTACGSLFYEGGGMDNCEKKSRALDYCEKELTEKLCSLPGKIGVIYKDPGKDGECFSFHGEEPHVAASVIKLFLMAAVFQKFEEGSLSPGAFVQVRREDCVPSCGVLNYLQGERQVSVRDLVELMVIVSDNTAANLLFDLVGEEYLDTFIREELGMKKTAFRRKMFDAEKAGRGIENTVTPRDVAVLLEKICRGTLVSPKASREMYEILKHQRLNGKIPFYLHTLKEAPVIAHKTGEDRGITHDVAIIGQDDPFVLCFLGSETDVPEYERLMGEAAMEIYRRRRENK